MYYQIHESISTINPQDRDPEKLTLGIISTEELERCYEQFGFSSLTVAECKQDSHPIHGSIDVYQDYLFGIMIGINASHITVVQDRIGIYIKHNLFLIVVIEDKDDSIRRKFNLALEHINIQKITMERLVFGFLERLISDDYQMLEKLENELSNYEERIVNRKLDKNFNLKITSLRKKLLLLDNYYEQLIVIGEELQENGIDLFNDSNLLYFRIFTDRVTRLNNNTRMLQDYSIHVREAYHALLDFNLNNVMKMFTVVTTIFLPLTLITSWYGMNFTTMPEITWKYGYLLVICLCILVAILCIIFFKKKKFLS
ncbi:MAG: Mg2 transporter protein CorA family protein [Herbinix sp.]|jgi:magnesium transporter|nr:Mg2 transporter protein CorA family protein [Herbinix sp.]